MAANDKTFIEYWFLALSDESVQSLSVPATENARKLYQRAQRYVTESKLRDWVLHQNVIKGLAPTTMNLNLTWGAMTQYIAQYDLEDDRLRGNVDIARNRMWSQRFRVRWGLSLGKMLARDPMPMPVLTQKVDK